MCWATYRCLDSGRVDNTVAKLVPVPDRDMHTMSPAWIITWAHNARHAADQWPINVKQLWAGRRRHTGALVDFRCQGTRCAKTSIACSLLSLLSCQWQTPGSGSTIATPIDEVAIIFRNGSTQLRLLFTFGLENVQLFYKIIYYMYFQLSLFYKAPYMKFVVMYKYRTTLLRPPFLLAY